MAVDVALYLVYFISLVILLILLRLCLMCARRKPVVTPPPPVNGRGPPRVLRQIRIDPSGTATDITADRQNTVELGRQHSRYGDIFYIEPNSQEAARIQEQLEKDEKDLPSYEEVMRMCNLTTPTAAAAALTQPPMMETSAIGIAALPAPPYSEIDPHRSVAAPPPSIATVTTVNMSEPSPSTSRAAQITT
ncbi:uncharacterized protein LOC6579160 isoform X3 [Drosophila mojavensis]|uniref:Uncharacterized protein, isoform P n=1 Tax=Drosophila mojavensis TaxID=7230 RepID=A0A0Q9XKX8_DROMO|nr:uncharacterized protein LOC6579160 isoform X3 [Drosophila mojavensis]KRG04403.1 uncharacterized protein Dmoj_GI20257, isoform P [Drosophila mojavensis]